MISAQQFVDAVEQNARRINAYQLGHDGSDGACDCIGLIIGALRLCGESWTGIHGSNWSARNAMRGLQKISSPEETELGMVVYKAREPNERGYALPERYHSGTDLRDYYHVGVVTKVSPLQITHCTGVPGGIRRDTALGAWRYGGVLKQMANGKEPAEMGDEYRVVGGNLNLRREPSRNAQRLLSIPDGSLVYAQASDQPGWMRVAYSDQTGYCMAQYLEKSEPETPGEGETIAVPLAELQAMAGQINAWLSRS